MAKKLPPVETRFKPGQSGNPGGKPKLPQELKRTDKLSKIKFREYLNKFIHMTKTELVAELQKPGSTMLEQLVGGMIARTVKDQDPVRANFLLDRLIGKVKDEMDVELKMKPTYIERRDGTMIELGHAPETIDAEVVQQKEENNENNS